MSDIAQKRLSGSSILGFSLGTDVVEAEKERASSNEFSSRLAFWLSTIGCSVGFGNLWRFPYLCYVNGGAAFLVPYFLMLFVVAIPVAIIEFGVGQLTSGGHLKGFRAIHRRTASLGWNVLISYCVLTYLPLLLAWTLMYMANSFKKDLPWLVNSSDVEYCLSQFGNQFGCEQDPACNYSADGGCAPNPLYKANYFFQVNLSADPDYNDGINEFNGYIFLCETFSWSLAFAGIIGGARIIGYINYVTTALPVLLLFVLVGVGASLDGASVGIELYIGKWDSTKIGDPAVWTSATSQTLFSLGATNGHMAGYSAHNKVDQNFVQDTYVVAGSDTLFAIIAGFAVFSVIGFLSVATGKPVEDLPLSGTGLAFLTYPVGISEAFSYPGAQIFLVLFFLMLFLLGMSSVLALLEAQVMVLKDSVTFKNLEDGGKVKPWMAYLAVILALYIWAFLSSTDMGLHFLDAIDHYLSTFGFIFAAFCEGLAGGWFAGLNAWTQRAGKLPVYLHMGTYLAGASIGAILGFTLTKENSINLIVSLTIALTSMVGGFVASIFLCKAEAPDGTKHTIKDRLYLMTMYNSVLLRDQMNSIACKDTIWRVPRAWCVLMKYIVTAFMSILFWSTVCTPAEMFKFPDPTKPYPWYLFLWGAFFPFVIFFGVLLFMILPQLMSFLWPRDEYFFTCEEFDPYLRKPLSTIASEDGSSSRPSASSSAFRSSSSISVSPSIAAAEAKIV